MTMLAAFQTLLYRQTGEDDVVVGADIANRNRGEIENLIGFFINMLVMRSDLSGNPSFTSVMDQVRETALGAFAHQDLPLEKMVEELRPGRGQNHSPLFTVVLVFQNTPRQILTVKGLTLTTINLPQDVSRFDLTLCISETSSEIRGYWAYSTELFDSSTISEMHTQFETLLQSIVRDPGTKLRDLEIFSDQHRQERLLRRQERDGANTRKLRSARRKVVDLVPPPPVVDPVVTEQHP
jgi:non-ribosomal peptide synthetase component F